MMADFRLILPDGDGIVGSVEEDGVLTFVVVAGHGCPIRGTEMFNLLLRAFGDKVRAIAGVWRRGFQGRPSVNLDKVNELTGSGAALTDAICKTWTATRAARWGFTRVSLVGTPVGVSGNFTRIDVLIERGEESA